MLTLTIPADKIGIFSARLSAAVAGATCSFDPEAGTVHVGDDFAATAQAIFDAGFDATKAELKAYAAVARYRKEVGGTTVGGVLYPTDRDTQAKMTAAVVLAQVNPAASFKWKLADGTFTPTLNAAAMTGVASAIGGFVNSCFATEEAVGAAIDAGTMTTNAQIDAAF